MSSQTKLTTGADSLDALVHGTYLGFSGALELPGPQLTEALSAVRRTETISLVAGAGPPWPVPVNTTTRQTTLWNLVRSYNSKMRVVGTAVAPADAASVPTWLSYDVELQRRYLFLNAPVLFDGLVEVRAAATPLIRHNKASILSSCSYCCVLFCCFCC